MSYGYGWGIFTTPLHLCGVEVALFRDAIIIILTFGLSLRKFLLCSIQVVDICGVMLAVVQAHDLATDHWLQGMVVVWEVR